MVAGCSPTFDLDSLSNGGVPHPFQLGLKGNDKDSSLRVRSSILTHTHEGKPPYAAYNCYAEGGCHGFPLSFGSGFGFMEITNLRLRENGMDLASRGLC